MRRAQKVFFLMLTTAIQSAHGETIILGHRGARALYPENTQEGFFKVLDAGIRNLELDIGMSKDGTLFIYHDSAINPLICNSTSVPVSFFRRPNLLHLTDKEIESFDCGSKTQWWRFPKQAKIPSAKIPKLKGFLEAVKKSYSNILPEITFLIEVKVKNPETGETAPPEVFAQKISALIEESGLKANSTVQSFSVEFLRQLKKHNPSIETALLWEQRWLPSVTQLRDLDLKVFLPKFSTLTFETVKSMQNSGYPVIAWTLNSHKDWKKALDWKLNGIITDDPIGLKKYMRATHLAR
jgi:glycerophosphoryl diester phosphodiesterase